MNTKAVILILLSIGLFYTFTSDRYEESKQLHALAANYKDILNNVSKIEEIRDSLQATYQSLPPADIDRVKKIMPDHNDVVRLALDLDGVAAKHGIALGSIKTNVDSSTASGGVIYRSEDKLTPYENTNGIVQVSISFVSSYEKLLEFMTDLEKNLRLMDLVSLSFQSNDEKANLYEYNLTFNTYWLK